MARADRSRILLAGDVPSPMAPPPGCHFHTRCVHAQAQCSQATPALVDDAGHAVACHLWRGIEPPVALPSAVVHAGSARLARLQSAFAA